MRTVELGWRCTELGAFGRVLGNFRLQGDLEMDLGIVNGHEGLWRRENDIDLVQ